MIESDGKALWCAVIQQALMDAKRPLSNLKRERLDQMRAREWLMQPNRDFEQVCALAGLEPSRVRARARELIEEAGTHKQPSVGLNITPEPKARSSRAHRFEYNGNSLTLEQLSQRSGIGVSTIRARLKKGWSVARAIKTPPNYGPGVGWHRHNLVPDRMPPVAQDCT